MTTAAVAIRNELDIMDVGRILAKSGFFADARQEAQAVVKVMAGAELGFAPIASMSGIHIIKGKPAVSANLMAAAVKRSGKYDYRIIAHTDKECTLGFFENGEKCGESSFTAADAKRAGTQNMSKFPRNMLFARAMSNGAKWFCPDIFGGPVYTPDELGQPIDVETGEILDIEPIGRSVPPTELVTPPIDAATVGWALSQTTDKGTLFSDLTAEQLLVIVDKQMGTLDQRNAAAILLSSEAPDIRKSLDAETEAPSGGNDYPDEMMQAIVEAGHANHPKHAVAMLNKSKAVTPETETEQAIAWAARYRAIRDAGGGSKQAGKAADKELS